MASQRLLHSLARVLPLFVLLLAVSRSAQSQPSGPGPPELAPDTGARLAQVSENTRLASWQRDLMLRLARTGRASAFDSPAADLRTAGAADGAWNLEWNLLLRPSARGSHSAIYDPVRDCMVVFGGPDFNDVWALSLAGTPAWAQLAPSGTPPTTRFNHSAVYDPVRDRMVVFGGQSGASGLNDVWALSLADTPAWTQLTPSGTPPSLRSGHSAIYDPVRDRMVVFGGSNLNDVWALSLAGTPAWIRLTPSGTPPTKRSDHSSVYDPVRDRMVIFGGYNPFVMYLGDVWALSLADTPVWTQLTPSGTPPKARNTHSAIYDSVNDRMVVFGGREDSPEIPYTVRCNDVWALSLADTPVWTQLNPSDTPPGVREAHGAIYDPVRDRMVIFAGYSGSAEAPFLNDV